jgi:hypothetical protein
MSWYRRTAIVAVDVKSTQVIPTPDVPTTPPDEPLYCDESVCV